MRVLVVTVAALICCIEARPANSMFKAKSMKDQEIKHSGESLASVRLLQSGKSKSLDPLPDSLPIQLTTGDGDLVLFLTKNKRLDLNKVKVTLGSGNKYQRKSNLKTAFYHDLSSGAAITVKHDEKSATHHFEGTLFSGGKRYTLQAASKSNNFGDKSLTILQVLESMNHKVYSLKEEVLDHKYSTEGTEQARPEIKLGRKSAEGEPTLDATSLNQTARVEDMRVKRASGSESHFHVEITMVLDYTIYQNFMERNSNNQGQAISEMEEYFGHIFNGMALAYSTIESTYGSVSITPWLKDFYICDTESSSWLTMNAASPKFYGASDPEDYVIRRDVFDNSQTWKTERGFDWHNPDHLMIFTRYDINGDGTIGIAPMGVICGGSGSWGGVSINEDIGLHGWSLTAHELGHNLGAPHDGNGNTCSNADQYIMTTQVQTLTTTTRANAYTFSSCSVTSMISNLRGSGTGTASYPKVCTLDTTCYHGEVLPAVNQFSGQLYDENEQCLFMFGEGYEYSNGYCQNNEEEKCLVLKCRQSGTNGCRFSTPAADGTKCGSYKWCKSGQCVLQTYYTGATTTFCTIKDLANVDPSCEDTPDYKFRITYNGVFIQPTCSEIITQYPSWCFEFSEVAAECDKSCQTYGLNYDGAQCTAPGECGGDTPGIYFNGGVSCSQAAAYGWCYAAVVQEYCCASCS